MNAHLNDEQMLDLLNEDAAVQGSPAAAHLRTCTACQAELALLRGSLATFRDAATNYAAIKTPAFAFAPHRISSTRPWLLTLGRQGWAASMATAVVLIAASVTLIHPRHDSASSNQTSGQMAHVPAPASSESDEALLDSIQRDLSTSIPPSLEPLALPAANSATSSHN